MQVVEYFVSDAVLVLLCEGVGLYVSAARAP